ncbi:MAG: exodeoxyribonuclease VII small subunit [Solobacterium sp.]|jgi:exodeoxyribonuclease VII small subunit|nr:exodeoxyribonuclease VII small subunit [Solobacterium sp.]MCH3962646.1 exodeoxyribonuclease VII small subunit [Solobacterium sp.]MCH4205025.1 exodeoxyribonuclease VII small subunit [Solobacterium sp.]MCH4226534.1 exodeoxyribonuclease VII small subunit [Solobacterium sp.]MCH4281818.1 exodeoxyribonuclease VII small subunit [Solobacterium sp.]
MAKAKPTFEESMARLEEIVAALEKNEKPLDETITLFEEGLHLVKSCDEKLKGYEDEINTLVRKNGSDSDEN